MVVRFWYSEFWGSLRCRSSFFRTEQTTIEYASWSFKIASRRSAHFFDTDSIPKFPRKAAGCNMQLTEVLENVLAGKQQIVSHDGTGQYQATSESTSVGTSACGLAALNCARKAFRLYQDPDDNCCWTDKTVVHDKDLLCRCLSRQTTEVGPHHSSRSASY